MTEEQIRTKALEIVARAHNFPSVYTGQDKQLAEYFIRIASPLADWIKKGE